MPLDPYCCQKPCWCLWSVLLWAVLGNDMVLLQWRWWLKAHNWRLLWQLLPHPPKKREKKRERNSPDRKLLERVLINCDKDASVYLFTFHSFCWGWERMGEGLSLFKELAIRSLTMPHWVYGQHKLNLVYFFFLKGWVGLKVGRVDLGRKGSECD